MKIISLCGGTSALLLFLFVSAPILAIQPDGKKSSGLKENAFTLVFEGNTLRAEIKQARLEDVLREIARQTDLAIEIDGSIADEKVSAAFDPLPVEEGLHAILRNKNYSLIYSEVLSAAGSDPQFRVEGIKIVGKANGPPPPIFRERFERSTPLPPQAERVQQENNTAAPPTLGKSADERMDDLEALADGKGMAAIPVLSQAANSDPDPKVREYAQELIQDVREAAEEDAYGAP